MTSTPIDLLVPRILIVDDERQIHASLRLRLGRDYGLVCHTDARQALALLDHERFDLCIVDIHMPHMDGLTFVEAARKTDPELGFIILSAFDNDENLRRTIPLQVYDFVSKPLPEKKEFEACIPSWIDQTRRRRRERSLAQQAGSIASDRESARLDREVELVASETARDALLQTANLLTTIHAHLVSATALMATRAKTDPGAGHLWRNLEEARKTTDAAMTVAEGFFDSGYGNRHSSPALLNDGMRHAISIATRMSGAEESNKAVDFIPVDAPQPLHGLTGIEFLLMLVPALGLALNSAPRNTTIGVRGEHFARLDTVLREPDLRGFLWVNRRNAMGSRPGILLTITATAAPLARSETEAWLKGEFGPLATVTPRGLISGIQKCHGLLGFSLAPESDQLRVVLALPT